MNNDHDIIDREDQHHSARWDGKTSPIVQYATVGLLIVMAILYIIKQIIG